MGKRELVLIALFVVIGVVVYQVTAPPAPPGSDLSVGGIFQRMRRNMQGARETATGGSHQAIPVGPSVRTLRLLLPRASDLTITAGDRADISVDVKTTARGYTPAEARTAADGAALKTDTTADAVSVSGVWTDRSSSNAGYLTQVAIRIEVPRQLAVRIEPHIGLLQVTGVASLECVMSRGETHVVDTGGAVVLSHSGGTLEVRGGASLKLTSRNGRGEVSAVRGPAKIDATGSRLKIWDTVGPLEIESQRTDVALDRIAGMKPGLRYNGQGGELRIEGLRVESRIDGRNTDMNVALDAPAPVTIYNLGAITVTAPPGGYTLDAVAQEGRITTDESGITPSDGPDSHAAGKVHGGGPALTLRATRGRIDLRSNGGK
jgi:hypothetical protein